MLVYCEARRLGCKAIVSKRLGSIYRRGQSPHWIKVNNPKPPAVTREAEEDLGRRERNAKVLDHYRDLADPDHCRFESCSFPAVGNDALLPLRAASAAAHRAVARSAVVPA